MALVMMAIGVTIPFSNLRRHSLGHLLKNVLSSPQALSEAVCEPLVMRWPVSEIVSQKPVSCETPLLVALIPGIIDHPYALDFHRVQLQ